MNDCRCRRGPEYLPGKTGPVVAAENQHFLQLLDGGWDQWDLLLLLTLLHVP